MDNFLYAIASKCFPCLNRNSSTSAASFAVILYSAIAFAIQLLHAPFITFFVDFSSRHLNISWKEFVIAQVIYGIWNSSNEFVFGYNSDVEDAESSSSSFTKTNNNNDELDDNNTDTGSLTRRIKSAKRRLDRVQKWGTFWAISFCFLWMPLNKICDFLPHVLLYTTVMIFYGGCFAFVTVQHRSLLVDITDDDHERQKCTLWSSVWGGIGSLSVVTASTAYAKLSLTLNDHHHHHQKEDGEEYASSSSSVAFRHWMVIVASIALVAGFSFFVLTGVLKKAWTKKVISESKSESPQLSSSPSSLITNANSNLVSISSSSSPVASLNSPNEKEQQNQQKTPTTSSSSSSSASLTCWETFKKVSAIPQMRTIYIVWLLQELCCYVLTSFFVSAATEIVNYWRSSSSSSSSSHDNEHNRKHQVAAANNNFFLMTIFNTLSGETWITLAVTCSFLIPQVVLIGLLPLVRQYGLDVVIANLFKGRAVFGTVTALFFSVWVSSSSSSDNDSTNFLIGPLLMIALLLSLRLFTECVCRLQPLVLTATCDENTSNNENWTASIMGASSLGSKPSQSIAPVLGYAILREIQQTRQQEEHHQHHEGVDTFNNENLMKHAIVLYGFLFGVATVPTALGSLLAWTIWPLKSLIGKKSSSGNSKHESQVV